MWTRLTKIHPQTALCILSVTYFITLPVLSSQGLCSDGTGSVTSVSTAAATTRCGSLFGFFGGIPFVIMFSHEILRFLQNHQAKFTLAITVGRIMMFAGMTMVLADPVVEEADQVPPVHAAGVLVLAAGNVLASVPLMTVKCAVVLRVLVGIQMLCAIGALTVYGIAGGGIAFLVMEIVVFAVFAAVVSALTEFALNELERAENRFPAVTLTEACAQSP